MNRGELRSFVSLALNFNSGQVDQDFTDAQLNDTINRVYTREVNKCKQEGDKTFFLASQEITWSSGDVTMPIPSVMKGDVLRIMDVTTDSVGEKVLFSDYGVTSSVFFKDRNTLQWGTTGPGSDRTLKVVYLAQPVKMTSDDDVPELIPEQFHELLGWASAIDLRLFADQKAPGEWYAKLEELRMDYYKHASLGRPWDEPNSFRLRDSDVTEEALF